MKVVTIGEDQATHLNWSKGLLNDMMSFQFESYGL